MAFTVGMGGVNPVYLKNNLMPEKKEERAWKSHLLLATHPSLATLVGMGHVVCSKILSTAKSDSVLERNY